MLFLFVCLLGCWVFVCCCWFLFVVVVVVCFGVCLFFVFFFGGGGLIRVLLCPVMVHRIIPSF